MYEHRHGGLPCEGSGQETEECNAWLDTKSDLIVCQAKSENSTTELTRLKQRHRKDIDGINKAFAGLCKFILRNGAFFLFSVVDNRQQVITAMWSQLINNRGRLHLPSHIWQSNGFDFNVWDGTVILIWIFSI